MLHVGSVCTPCCMLLRVVASCCAMLDPFAQLLQLCWGHARALHMVCLEFTKSYRYVSFPRCTAGPNIVWSCCIRLHTTAKTDTTIPNSVASVFTGLDLNRSPLFKCVCVWGWGLGLIFQLSKASKKWLSCSSRPKKGFALGVAVYRKWHPPCLANYKWGLAGSGYSYRCCSWGDGCGSNIGLSKHKQLGFLFFLFFFLFPQFNVG